MAINFSVFPTLLTLPFFQPSPNHGLSLTSLTTSLKLCVFVMWMLLSGDNGIVKMSGVSAADSGDFSAARQCVLKGRVYTERLWYGYLIDKAFNRDYAKIQYTISYPVDECCTNLLIYYDDQIKQLTQDMSCEERERVLPNNNNQVIPLHNTGTSAGAPGCRVINDTGEPLYLCVGERIFRSAEQRTWYFVLSRCKASTSLTVDYAFNITGYHGDCEEDPLSRTSPLSTNCTQTDRQQTAVDKEEPVTTTPPTVWTCDRLCGSTQLLPPQSSRAESSPLPSLWWGPIAILLMFPTL